MRFCNPTASYRGVGWEVGLSRAWFVGTVFVRYAPSWIGLRKIAPDPVPSDTAEAYRQTVRTLFKSCANCGSAAGEPFVLRLADEAANLLKCWEKEVESQLAEGGEMERITDWGGKLVGETVRIAAVFHCVEFGPVGRIDAQTLAAAIEIALYLIPHAEAALSLMEAKEGESANDDAAYILRWIKRQERASSPEARPNITASGDFQRLTTSISLWPS